MTMPLCFDANCIVPARFLLYTTFYFKNPLLKMGLLKNADSCMLRVLGHGTPCPHDVFWSFPRRPFGFV